MEEDNILIKKYLEGDQSSLKTLIDKYTSPIYNFTTRFIPSFYRDDIVQDVFIKVWKNLGNFDLNKSQFKTWLFTITRNTITDYYRKKKATPFSYLKEDELNENEIEDIAPLPDIILEKLQDKETLDKVLNDLKDEYKTVVTLYYQEDMTFKEIGEVLGKPMNTVKSYHYRALKILHQKLL